MSLILEPETYAPSIDETGTYIDEIPSTSQFKRGNGIRCPCGRVEKCYETRPSFVMHVKSAMHQKWIQHLNANRQNHLVELEEAKRIIDQQKRIIARLEHEVSGLTVAIQTLSRQPFVPPSTTTPVIDLLDF